MVQRAMKFTPEVLLSAPRRSAGVPNTTGDKILYTQSTYSFATHSKSSELHVLEAETRSHIPLANDNEAISDLNWLDTSSGDEFACLQVGKDGTTDLCIGDASSKPSSDGWKPRHYVAGKVDAPAGNLKVAKLDADGKEFAVVVSAQVATDGSLFNPEKAKKTHSTGRLYDGLYVRHWDQYEDKEKSTLWYGKLTADKHGRFKLCSLTNALKKTGLECPVQPFGGTDNFDICHNCIFFVAKDPKLNPALNTKSNVYIINISSWDGSDKVLLKNVIIPGFEGASASPVISPDGKKAAFLSMKKNGYEADKNQIFVLPDLATTDLTPRRAFTQDENYEGAWDRSPSSICFTQDSKSLLAIAEDYGHSRLFMLKADLTDEESPRRLTSDGFVTDCKPLTEGRIFISGSTVVDNSFFAVVDPWLPPGRDEPDDEMISWSNSKTNKGNNLGLNSRQVSSIWTPASNKSINKEVHSIVVKPSNFDFNKTYPVAYLIHGGPQGSWGDNWSTRWNLALFAEQGYIVVAPNPTGSTGYGQKFTDAIRMNWGGDPYQDIVNCFDWVGENMKEADNSRAVALGASYGGYMVNWIQGHDLGRKFKALVCHDGILSMAGMIATEELYFPFHDVGGTPWYDPGFRAKDSDSAAAQGHRNFGGLTFNDWRKWDPSEHFSNWATPELVIHSSKDYRICISDGLAAFNVLQARGVDSQFLTFPDENHWVLKPENSLAWHKVVLNWINKHVGLPAYTEQDQDGEEFWGGARAERQEVVDMVTQGKPET